MKYLKYDLGHQRRGSTAVVTLQGTQANVRLMTPANVTAFKAGRRVRFWGGRATKSPVRLPIPHDGSWAVIVDMGGLRGDVRAGVRVEPPPLRPIRTTTSADVLANDGYGPIDDERERLYDVFICHASEDKAFVRPLVAALSACGLAVWYAETAISSVTACAEALTEDSSTVDSAS